ncbi:MAG: serine/threonine protein kinase [Kiritimatiellaeota bacterium]|nr:serine/threonine protein kinase [Kiritimatiellota bacterium]
MEESSGILQPESIVAEKFKVLEHIGSGSVGDEFYLCEQTDLNRKVQLKLISKDSSDDDEMVQRFIQGVNLAASLTHPNILPVYEAGSLDDKYYVATAWKETRKLKDILKTNGSFVEKEAIQIVLGIIDALNYAWNELTMIHRNVTPETILIASDGKPLLEDFGMAKITDTQQSANLTMTGFTIGNLEYMSPEQVRGERDLDFQADMYCLGLVFYEILTGDYPFKASSQMEYMQAHVSKKPTPVKDINIKVRQGCSDIVDQMLAKDKNDRFESWTALSEALKNVLEGRAPNKSVKDALKEIKAKQLHKQPENTPSSPPPITEAEKEADAKKLKVLIIGSIVVIVIVILAILFGLLIQKTVV